MACRLAVPRGGGGLTRLLAPQRSQSRFWYIYEFLLLQFLLITSTNSLRNEPISLTHVTALVVLLLERL